MFAKILIANRGEIACRVIRTARRMGVATVAVYSAADARALHVEMADEAHAIGPAPARESYLRIDRIIDAARKSGAEAVHPGYGFLSENAEFAEACAAAGIVFIGPPPAAIRAMGSKAASKALMEKAGVPLVPGYHGDDQGPARLGQEVARIGFPVLIKASAGGGGKGMRIVERTADFAAALAGAQREAKASFGDDRVLIEKYLERPRHIEMQVFADTHGNCVHLFERDCSIQRRHQKVLEEAPAPGMTAARRQAMGAAAIAAAKAVGYVGAGTVEFIAAGEAFHFMEMNTRLQVEHPVTEMITGTDLVEWQLRVAAGEKLPLRQEDLAVTGHAVEVRLYAEDPARDFLPASGALLHFRTPAESRHLRVDTGVRAGDRIGIDYDPMIAKLIVWDADRGAALRRLRAALAATEIIGLANNAGFLARLAAEAELAAGPVDTGFIARHRESLQAPAPSAAPSVLAAVSLALLAERTAAARTAAARSAEPSSPWAMADGWRLGGLRPQELLLQAGGETHKLRALAQGGAWTIETAGAVIGGSAEKQDAGRWQIVHDGVRRAVTLLRRGPEILLAEGPVTHHLTLLDLLAPPVAAGAAGGHLMAPMPGKVIAVLVAVGAAVTRGAPLVLLEAMKMEHTVTAPADGVVARVNYREGELVEEGAELLVIDDAAPAPEARQDEDEAG